MLRTYTIELRADLEEDKHEILLKTVRATAREMYTTASLLKDKREPQIRLEAGDMFESNKDMDISIED